MTYGPQDSLVDFLHVDNLVQAHILAGEGLSERKNCVAVSIELDYISAYMVKYNILSLQEISEYLRELTWLHGYGQLTVTD